MNYPEYINPDNLTQQQEDASERERAEKIYEQLNYAFFIHIAEQSGSLTSYEAEDVVGVRSKFLQEIIIGGIGKKFSETMITWIENNRRM